MDPSGQPETWPQVVSGTWDKADNRPLWLWVLGWVPIHVGNQRPKSISILSSLLLSPFSKNRNAGSWSPAQESSAQHHRTRSCCSKASVALALGAARPGTPSFLGQPPSAEANPGERAGEREARPDRTVCIREQRQSYIQVSTWTQGSFSYPPPFSLGHHPKNFCNFSTVC